jgi:hypothetical protein
VTDAPLGIASLTVSYTGSSTMSMKARRRCDTQRKSHVRERPLPVPTVLVIGSGAAPRQSVTW